LSLLAPGKEKEFSSPPWHALMLSVFQTYYRHSLSMKHSNSYFESSRNLKTLYKCLKIIKYRVVQKECEVLSQVVSCCDNKLISKALSI
jgi:hypothetical protein